MARNPIRYKTVIQPGIEGGTLNKVDEKSFNMNNILGFVRGCAGKELPKFGKRTSKLDRALQSFLLEEKTGFLAGFIDQAAMIQSNRRWTMIGSRPLIQRVLDVFQSSEGGEGLRMLLRMSALNYYCANFGAPVYLYRENPVTYKHLEEIDRYEWDITPVVQMFATDPTLFEPTNDWFAPYTYARKPMGRYDFIRAVSMPSTMSDTWTIGRCALYRVLTVARMTSAIYDHMYNIVAPDVTKGIITILGMSADEFLDAMKGNDSDNEDRRGPDMWLGMDNHTSGLVVLADPTEEIKVKYTTLSRLPDSFSIDGWLKWTLTSFATNLGFPLEEFIGSQASQLLGQSGSEVKAGERRSVVKGAGDFILQMQDRLRKMVIPRSVLFEFADRDTGAELERVTVQHERARIIKELFEASQLIELDEQTIYVMPDGTKVANKETEREAKRQSQRIISAAEARRIAVEWGVLPEWITVTEGKFTVSDDVSDVSQIRLRGWREAARESSEIQRLAAQPLGEPILRYENWVDDNGTEHSSSVTLWDSDDELARASVWRGASFPLTDTKFVTSKPPTGRQ